MLNSVDVVARASIVILISGAGTLAHALLTAANAGNGPRVVGVIADQLCPGLALADELGVPTDVVNFGDYPDRGQWDAALTIAVEKYQPDWVVTAGFMKILGAEFISKYSGKIINSHPALLPAFPGAHAVRDALTHGVKITGTTVHLVDGGVDTGPILAQAPVPVLAGDTEETLHERIKVCERELLTKIVAAVANYGISIEGRKASVND